MTDEILDQTEQQEGRVLAELIRKYAILLSFFLVVEKVLGRATGFLARVLGVGLDSSSDVTWWYTFEAFVPFFMINIIVAVVLYQDMRNRNTVMRTPVIFVTLFFHAIGVCLFLLLVVLKEVMRSIKTRGQGSGWEAGQ